MINDGVVLTEEALLWLLSVINKVDTLPKDIISDTSIATNTSYSSYNIENKLTNLEDKLKQYSSNLVNNLNRLTKEVINDKSLATKENVLYLYKSDSDQTNNYMQIMNINNNIIELGSTEVDFSNYLTKEQCLNNFVAKIDFDNLTESFNELKNTVTSHINDDIHVIPDDKIKWNKVEDKLDKSMLTEVLNAESTIDQIPNAKVIFDVINETKVDNIVYTNNILSDALTIKKNFFIFSCSGTKYTGDAPTENHKYGKGYVIKRGNTEKTISITLVWFPESIKNGVYIYNNYLLSENKWEEQRLCITNVSDESKTIEFDENALEYYSIFASDPLKYMIIDGVCYVNGGINVIKSTSSLKVATSLPVPKNGLIQSSGSALSGSTSSVPTIQITESGNLYLAYGINGVSYRYNFNYPVA